MIWGRLKDDRCPKDDCYGKLKAEGLLDLKFVCEEECGFTINEAVYMNITRDRYKEKLQKPRETKTVAERNQEALNNL